LKLFAFGISSLTHYLVYPTITATERAIQRCPDAPNVALTNALVASYLSQSGITIQWFLAPILL